MGSRIDTLPGNNQTPCQDFNSSLSRCDRLGPQATAVYPTGDAGTQKWNTNEQHTLQASVTPLPGKSVVHIHIRLSMSYGGFWYVYPNYPVASPNVESWPTVAHDDMQNYPSLDYAVSITD